MADNRTSWEGKRYVDATLLTDETLLYFARPHWIIFAPAAFAFFVSLFFLHYGPHFLNFSTVIAGHTLYGLSSAFAAIIGSFWSLTSYIQSRTSEYAITDKRLIMKTGWLRRDAVEVFLIKLEAVNVVQSIMGRVFNYGTIIIVGTGGTKDCYYSIPNPLVFRREVQQHAERAVDHVGRSGELGE